MSMRNIRIWLALIAGCLAIFPAYATERVRIEPAGMPIVFVSMLGDLPYFSYKGATVFQNKEGGTSASGWDMNSYLGAHVKKALESRGYTDVRILDESSSRVPVSEGFFKTRLPEPLLDKLSAAGAAAGARYVLALAPLSSSHPQYPVRIEGYGLFYTGAGIAYYVSSALILVDAPARQMLAFDKVYDLNLLDLPYRPSPQELEQRRREEAEAADSYFKETDYEVEHDPFKIWPNHRYGEYDAASDDDKAVMVDRTKNLFGINLYEGLYEIGVIDCVDSTLVRDKHTSFITGSGSIFGKKKLPVCS